MLSIVFPSRSLPRLRVVLVSLRRAQSYSRFSSCIHKEPHWIAGNKVEYSTGKRNWVGHICGWRDHQQRLLHTGKVLLGKVIPFDLPDVGEAIQTVEVKEWLVNVGDTVSLGDSVCEVQSDKSAVVIYSPYDGVIRELKYEAGDVATKGKPILMIEVEEEDLHEIIPKIDTPTPPTLSDEIQITRAVRNLASENSVNLSEVKGTGKNGRILKEDVLNFIQSVSSKVSDVVSDVAAGMRRPEGLEKSSGAVLATPAVRHMAKKEGVNLSEVRGTGKDGHVLKEDLLRHIRDTSSATPTATPPLPDTLSEGDRVEKIKGFKAVMVKTMTISGQIPQFGYCDEVDMSELVSLRASLKKLLEEEGLRFSYMPILVKAISNALHEYPSLNAAVDSDCTTITYKADHNIGIAMDTSEGLVVPNIKQVQNKSVLEITRELNRLQELGAKGKLSLSDIRGGTLSISNIGAIGGTYARPLCLPPEVVIVAFGKVHVLPRFSSSGDLYSAHVMHASWSADHRVIDGATMARFSNKWKALVEEPSEMIAELRSSLTNEKSPVEEPAS